MPTDNPTSERIGHLEGVAATLRAARELDGTDRLAHLRRQFHLPAGRQGRRIYLCGHSLGLQPRGVAAIIAEVLDDWRSLAVSAHFDANRPWFSYHEEVAEGLAELAGAGRSEVVAMNSLTVNLHLMMASFYRPEGKRRRILIEAGAFPSDRYAVDSHIAWHGFEADAVRLDISPRNGEWALRSDDIIDTIERHADELALVLLPGVQYLSGQALDMAGIAEACRRHDIRFGLDLAHAIGNLPLQLHDWDVDFAVWCSYKYLNAGPGAVAGCFVHERWARADLPRLAGWWGQDKRRRFAMEPEFHAMPGAEGWQLSNPSILGLAPLIVSLALFRQAGIRQLHAKSRKLTGFLEQLITAWLIEEIEIITPQARGCQLSLRLRGGRQRARRVFEALAEGDIMADWREPDIIRLAPVPLYNRFQDIYRAVDVLRRAVDTTRR